MKKWTNIENFIIIANEAPVAELADSVNGRRVLRPVEGPECVLGAWDFSSHV